MRKRKAKCGAPLGIYPMEPVPGQPPAAFEQTMDTLYVLVDGRRVAQRGKPNTPQAKTWVPLEPGFRVYDDAGRTGIVIEQWDVKAH
jgi:hypothetical protein